MTLEEKIYNRCKKQVDKFNEEYERLCKEYDDRQLLVDEDKTFYGLKNSLQLVKDDEDGLIRLDCDGFLSYPIYDYYEDTKEVFDNTGDKYWGDGFNACMEMYKKDLKRGKRFLAMDSERIDAIQNGDIEDEEE